MSALAIEEEVTTPQNSAATASVTTTLVRTFPPRSLTGHLEGNRRLKSSPSLTQSLPGRRQRNRPQLNLTSLTSGALPFQG
jgi:hypothetical protein